MIQFIFLRLLKFASVDKVFTLLFRHLFSITPILVRQVGILPVGYSIVKLYQWLQKGYNITIISELVKSSIHPVIIRDLFTVIYPMLEQCLLKKNLLINFFRLYTGIFMFGLIRPIIRLIFKYSFGLIFSSVGIVLNEVLSSISVLKWISDTVLYYIPIMPWIDSIINPVKHHEVPIDTNNKIDYSSLFSTFGLILIGAGSVFIVILIGDYFIPDITRAIPGVDYILNSWYGIYDYLMSYFHSNPDLPPRSPADNLAPLDSISRSSSGSSTVTGNPITPAPTRPSTPEWFPPFGEDGPSNPFAN